MSAGEAAGLPGSECASACTGIAQCDRQYRLVFISPALARIAGKAADEMIGRRIDDVLGTQMFQRIRPGLDAALEGKAKEDDIDLALHDNGLLRLHLDYAPAFDTQSKICGAIVAFWDVSPKRMQELMPHREREFESMVENSPDAIMRLDRNMRQLYVNPAMELITGLKPKDYLDRSSCVPGLPGNLAWLCENTIRTVFDTAEEQRLEFEYGNGTEQRHYCARVLAEPGADGKVESVLTILYDITERKKMENEHELLLARERAARIQAETAARVRDQFLAIVSHELRAPLNGIQSWAHVLENYVKETASDPLAQRALSGIKTGVAQQVRLIEDLLDASRVMSGKLRLVKQPITLLPIIQAAVESVRAAAAAKHIDIQCVFAITSEQIDGDPDRLQQIVWNLLCNAIKFTPDDGHIWLNATATENHIVITVRDDGIGISRDFLPYLFDRFSQKDTSSTRGHSGLGLGLYLVHRLVELHGGSIKAESVGEGKGSCFSVQLPLRSHKSRYLPASQNTEVARSSLPSLQGLRILLIDDQEEVRESLAVMLSASGADVFATGSAQEVLEWLPSAEPESLPHILICDIAMPVEDGYTVLRKLRSWNNGKGPPPLGRMPALALTAFAQREDRIKALTAGFQMHMTKPVAPEELIIVIAMMATRG